MYGTAQVNYFTRSTAGSSAKKVSLMKCPIHIFDMRKDPKIRRRGPVVLEASQLIFRKISKYQLTKGISDSSINLENNLNRMISK